MQARLLITMSNGCTKFFQYMKHIVSRCLCLFFHCLQAGVLDYYLIIYKGQGWFFCIAADVAVAIVFVMCFYYSYIHLKHLEALQTGTDNRHETDSEFLPISPIAWFLFATLLSIKVGICYKDFVFLLDEATFFGPNTLKTNIALAGIIFTLLLSTNHDAKPGSDRRKYIDELTGTVIFDILDCVDSMEILYNKEDRDTFPIGLDDAIIAVAILNFILPTVPLITLSKTKYGQAKLSHKLVMIHKICLAFFVNLPLLITRMMLWHGLGHGISIFSLKNIVVIGIISFDLYETLAENENTEKKECKKGSPTISNDVDLNESYALEDRFNYIG